LKELGVPVLLNSSKTLAEISQIAQDLELDTPQIAENGSIIYYPKTDKVHYLGADYIKICQVIDTLREEHNYAFRGFHDWSAAQITEHTGLSLEASENASKRQGTEPLLWDGDIDQIENFKQQLYKYELELKRGGRFWHVMGKTDKAEAMQHIKEEFKTNKGIDPFTIALGDSENDKDMLSAANVAVLVKNPKGSNFEINSDKTPQDHQLIKTSLEGPAGWNEAMTQLLNEL